MLLSLTEKTSLLTDNECRVWVNIISKQPYTSNGESPLEWKIPIAEKYYKETIENLRQYSPALYPI